MDFKTKISTNYLLSLFSVHHYEEVALSWMFHFSEIQFPNFDVIIFFTFSESCSAVVCERMSIHSKTQPNRPILIPVDFVAVRDKIAFPVTFSQKSLI